MFLRKSLLDTFMQIFIMLRDIVAEISRFKFDDYRVIRIGASDLKLFLGGVGGYLDFHFELIVAYWQYMMPQKLSHHWFR